MCFPLGTQKEFFQDDVYPDTTVWWEPALTASAWLSGSDGRHKKMSLKPNDMTPGTKLTVEAESTRITVQVKVLKVSPFFQ